MDWSWLAEYGPDLLQGFWLTLKLLIVCSSLGMLMAIVIGLVQVTGPKFPAAIARGFCTYIRGTPLLIQLWLIYYGLGELFPQIDGIKDSFIWPLLRAAIPYAIFAFTLSVAGYVGEIMRGAFAGVPKGELEAARAMGMSPFKVLMRVWLPRALQNVFSHPCWGVGAYPKSHTACCPHCRSGNCLESKLLLDKKLFSPMSLCFWWLEFTFCLPV